MRNPYGLPALFCSSLLFIAACSDDSSSSGKMDASTPLADAGKVADAGHPGMDKDAALPSGDDAGNSDDAGPALCSLTSDLQFGQGGGFINSSTAAELKKPSTLTITRSSGGTDTSCTPQVPPCGTSGKLDVADINSDLDNADVKAAFASADPPTYGSPHPDSGLFRVTRDDGKTFNYAGPCPVDESDSGVTCPEVPAGVLKLVHDLQALEDYGLNSKTCSNL